MVSFWPMLERDYFVHVCRCGLLSPCAGKGHWSGWRCPAAHCTPAPHTASAGCWEAHLTAPAWPPWTGPCRCCSSGYSTGSRCWWGSGQAAWSADEPGSPRCWLEVRQGDKFTNESCKRREVVAWMCDLNQMSHFCHSIATFLFCATCRQTFMQRKRKMNTICSDELMMHGHRSFLMHCIIKHWAYKYIWKLAVVMFNTFSNGEWVISTNPDI